MLGLFLVFVLVAVAYVRLKLGRFVFKSAHHGIVHRHGGVCGA